MPDEYSLSGKNEQESKKQINFQEIPKETKALLENSSKAINQNDSQQEEPIAVPITNQQLVPTYLSLVLSPDLRELEMMIRGLEFIKKHNNYTGKDEIILRKIKDHPLNEYGVNQIMQQLKVYSSPEIKLGRKRARDYYNSVQHVCRGIVRLIYKNLKNFGMDNQVKQRNAKVFCDAIIEMVDASFSRSIEGKENDLSRATEFKIEGSVDALNNPHGKVFTPEQKEQLKN